MPRFIVMSAATKMPSSCKWGPYKRVALVDLVEGFEGVPKIISERALGVRRIVRTWERLSARGTGGNTAFDRGMREAHAEATRLNGEGA